MCACKRFLSEAFTVRDMGNAVHFLGMHISRNLKALLLHLGQRQYVANFLDRYDMADCRPVRLCMVVDVRMERDGVALDAAMSTTYQEVVGSLLFPANCTRPDISFAVS